MIYKSRIYKSRNKTDNWELKSSIEFIMTKSRADDFQVIKSPV